MTSLKVGLPAFDHELYIEFCYHPSLKYLSMCLCVCVWVYVIYTTCVKAGLKVLDPMEMDHNIDCE